MTTLGMMTAAMTIVAMTTEETMAAMTAALMKAIRRVR
jgi:hypothetical protein